MNATLPVLDVSNLSVALGNFVPVQNVSFRIETGEVMALVGESGCGKSMTALSILSLLPNVARIARGSIMFRDVDLVQLGAAELRSIRGNTISLIPQEPMTSLNPVMSIGVQIGEVLRRHLGLSAKMAERRVVELLDLVGIPEPHRRLRQYPHNFSGGMRQRVMIAMAVACNPKLLIADEPTTALDVTIQAQVMDLIDRLRREMSLSVLLITHDLGVVAQWADRVAVMYAGRIVEQASTSRFFAAPQHPYSAGLLSSSIGGAEDWHYTNHRLKEIPGNVSSAALSQGCPFAPRCERVMEACLQADPQLQEIDHGWAATCRRGAIQGVA